ncbi:MAG: ISKra4 family transposase [Chloroflexota bacterium]|jgi:hypothetical protein|nr:ISKra4 family transposase [Chloroflexota bacterium]
MDDTMRQVVVAAVEQEVSALFDALVAPSALDLEQAERLLRAGVLAIGARVLAAGLAARGTGKAGPRVSCACGGQATFEGYRSKAVQTLVGWIAVRRAYYHCPACHHGQVPLDQSLALGRDSHSPMVRRLASQFGALVPFAQAAATLADAASIQLSPSTVRVVSEAVGARRDSELLQQVTRAWQDGLSALTAPATARLYVAMDGVRIMSTTGEGKEAKVGVVVPEQRRPDGQLRRDAASYVASFATATAFGPRLALEAHRRGLDSAAEVVVLGDGAEWIWNLTAEHFPHATQIVDWYHASERIWDLGRALYGETSRRGTAWIRRQLAGLADGQVRRLVTNWRRRACTDAMALVRDEQVTYFTNQASRMAYDQYRERGLDIGSGMVESACKYVIGTREKGPGMRWSIAGAQAVANVRVLVLNNQWNDYDLAA